MVGRYREDGWKKGIARVNSQHVGIALKFIGSTGLLGLWPDLRNLDSIPVKEGESNEEGRERS